MKKTVAAALLLVSPAFAGLSLREQVAQLVMVPFYGEALNTRSAAYREYERLVREVGVGGLILVNRVERGLVRNAEPYALAAFLNRMQRLAPVPLIVAGDFERGASMRVAVTARFPHAMAYGVARDLAETRYLGEATAREARALGVHWIFAPVADVNNNPDNPIINIRSFGEDPQTVAAHVKAFIEGAHRDSHHPVLVTAKHFPGHGDTAVDSHVGLPAITASRVRLNQVELAPFRAAIAAGVDAIMTAHITVRALDPQTVPATVASAVLTRLLRQQLGFNGLVVTDAMDMQGLTKLFEPGEAAVRALQAGADVLLMPPKPEEAIRAVVAAVEQGRLPRHRIEQSAARVLAAKARLGLNQRKLVDLEAIADQIDTPEDEHHAMLVAERAVKLVKNDRRLVPLAQPESTCFAVFIDNRYSQQGRRFLDEVRARVPKAQMMLLDPESEPARASTSGCKMIVVAAFVSFVAYKGSIALPPNLSALLNAWIKGSAPVVLVALGNPYLIRSFPGVAAYLATYSTVPASETAAAKALVGALRYDGRRDAGPNAGPLPH